MDNAERKKILNLINTSVTPTTELSMEADEKAENAEGLAIEANELARDAEQIAGETNQYFWHVEDYVYFLSADTTVDSFKTYYIESEESGEEIFTPVTPVGTENPSEEGWYERSSDTGAHITEIPKEEFLQDPDNGGGNLLARSAGLAVRDGLEELATFSSNGIRIGQTGQSRAFVTFNSLELKDKEGNTYFEAKDLRDSNGQATWTDTFYGNGTETVFLLSLDAINDSYTVTVSDSSGGNVYLDTDRFGFDTAPTNGATITATYVTESPYAKSYTVGWRLGVDAPLSLAEGRGTQATEFASHAEGCWSLASGKNSHAEGEMTRATGENSHAEGSETSAEGGRSHSEGSLTSATGGGSHAEGNNTTASGAASHAEGWYSTASGDYSHAESRSTASGNYSHAENSSTASGNHSHAEGYETTASGGSSHSGGEGTIATKKAQMAIGSYNVEDTSSTTTHPSGTTAYGEYAFIIGNGSSENLTSNAFSVDWNGKVEAGGDITDGSGNVLSNKVNSSSLASVATSGDYGDLINKPTLPAVESWTPNITAATGTLVEKHGLKFGNVYFLSIGIRKTSSTASGANLFSGTLSNNKPTYPVNGGGYEGAVPAPALLNTNGVLNVRNASPSAYTMGSTSNMRISFTYIIDS